MQSDATGHRICGWHPQEMQPRAPIAARSSPFCPHQRLFFHANTFNKLKPQLMSEIKEFNKEDTAFELG